jgi:hypothetical protein
MVCAHPLKWTRTAIPTINAALIGTIASILDAFRGRQELVSATNSGLMGLFGIDIDPPGVPDRL